MGIDGLAEAIAELEEMAAHAADATPVMQGIATDAAEDQREHLIAERSQGGGMQALSPDYAAWKRKKYPGKTILRRTDAMLSSITSNAGPTFAEAGPTDEKARYHASPEARSVMPLRDPFYVTDDVVEKGAEKLVDYIGPRP